MFGVEYLTLSPGEGAQTWGSEEGRLNSALKTVGNIHNNEAQLAEGMLWQRERKERGMMNGAQNSCCGKRTRKSDPGLPSVQRI